MYHSKSQPTQPMNSLPSKDLDRHTLRQDLRTEKFGYKETFPIVFILPPDRPAAYVLSIEFNELRSLFSDCSESFSVIDSKFSHCGFLCCNETNSFIRTFCGCKPARRTMKFNNLYYKRHRNHYYLLWRLLLFPVRSFHNLLNQKCFCLLNK